MRIKQTLIAAAVLGLLSSGAYAVDFTGYTRVGPGQKQASGDGQRCFNGGGVDANGSAAPGHGGIGRLGNECNTYGEFGLVQNATMGGVTYKAELMTNFYSTGSTPDTSQLGNQLANTPAVSQLYLEGKGYDIAPNVSFWVGRRFYHRADVHFDDSFYLMGGLGQNATGAGADGIDTGFGSLGVAVFRFQDSTTTTNAGTLLNFDLQSMPVNPGGQLRLVVSSTKFDGAGGKSGLGLTLQHIQSGLPGGGINTLFLQTARGSAGLDMGFGAFNAGSDTKSWRIADSLAWLNGPLTAQTLIHYGHAQNPTGLGGTFNTKTLSIAGRVAYALTKNFKMQAEVGTANTKVDGKSSENVTKFTIAPTLTVGPNFYDRPEIRFYVSAFSYNNAYALANGQSKTSKTAAGVQLELWF